MMKNNARIIVRMSAAHWDAKVRMPDGAVIAFDIKSMDKHQRRDFTRTLVRCWRESRVAA